MFKNFFAKLMRFGGKMPARQESTQEKFQRKESGESELAEEREQANLRRMAEKQSQEGQDLTDELEKQQEGGSN